MASKSAILPITTVRPDYSSYSGNELVKIKRAGMKARKGKGK